MQQDYGSWVTSPMGKFTRAEEFEEFNPLRTEYINININILKFSIFGFE